jgi:hypothetical protein
MGVLQLAQVVTLESDSGLTGTPGFCDINFTNQRLHRPTARMAIRQNVLSGCITAALIDSKPKRNADEVAKRIPFGGKQISQIDICAA